MFPVPEYPIPSVPLLARTPREREPQDRSTWVTNKPSTNHPRLQPVPGYTSVIHPQRTASTALPGQAYEPSSYVYPSNPHPTQLAQPLFFPGTSDTSSIWGSSGLAGIPNNRSGPGGWPRAPRIPNVPLARGQPLVETTTFSTCACASCAAARQSLVPLPPQLPNPPRLNLTISPSLPPSRPQAGTSGVPARSRSTLGDWEAEDLLEPRAHRLPYSYASYESPATLHHNGVTFTLSHFLGKGAAGRVVLGEHRGQLYAVKGIHKRHAQKCRHTRNDFLREKTCMMAIAAAGRSKRFLMSLVMSWEEPEIIYFVMPFHPVDLYTALKSDLPLSWHDRYTYCKELICALCELRRLGIVHRDIKPSNILIAQDGRAILTDFGMAQLVHPEVYEIWRRPGYSGTYAYMAPEMVREGSVHGAVADVWSMGLVFLEILRISPGRHFKSVDIEGIRREHATRLPIDSAIQPALVVHPSMTGLVISMLQADSRRRITAQHLQGEYVLSEAWSDVREGRATHDWKPHAGILPRFPAGRLLDFLTFRAHEDPLEAMRDHQQVGDAAQFEYRAPGVFEFPQNVVLGALHRM
ncbi:kinase-like domain-containing protein [Ganoderma leucocontextum]|nr:kinase-like domain-containing protein [Ganoderma leucocontextum]